MVARRSRSPSVTERAFDTDEARNSRPSTITVVSHNLWLIPFAGAWHFGRAERCGIQLAAAAGTSFSNDAESLVVVAVQEAWAYRVGVFWPMFYCWGKLEAWLLRCKMVDGCREPLFFWLFKSAAVFLIALSTLLAQNWVPKLRDVMWEPKRHLRAALSIRATLPWSTDGVSAFRALPPWTLPICLMDSGLHTSASRPADDSGFVGFSRTGSAEAVVLKGMLWCRWGSLAIVNTHMTFEHADGGVQRRRQQEALSSLVGKLLGLLPQGAGDGPSAGPMSGSFDPSCDLSGVPLSSCGSCSAVLIAGDLNHCLPAQCTSGAAGKPPTGTYQYRQPWLPANASLAHLLDVLALGGAAKVERLSSDEPTNEDGTIDHLLLVTPAPRGLRPRPAAYTRVSADVIPDDHAEVSDHLSIKVVVRAAGEQRSKR